MYKVTTRKDGSKDVKAIDPESADERTTRLQIKAIVNGLVVIVEQPGRYIVSSTNGSTRYAVRWVRSLRLYACECRGYHEFLYKFPGCPCLHVATVLIEIGPMARDTTPSERTMRRAATMAELAALYVEVERPALVQQTLFSS